MSPDPNVDAKAAKSQGGRADLQSTSNQLVAADEMDSNAFDIGSIASDLL